jgi:hypothetical protein
MKPCMLVHATKSEISIIKNPDPLLISFMDEYCKPLGLSVA